MVVESVDLGIKNVPVVDMARNDEEDDEGSSVASEHESVTSHECGIEIVSDGSSEDEDQRLEVTERFEALVSGEGKTTKMHKHLRKRLKHQVKEIKEAFYKEDRRVPQPLKKDSPPMSRSQVKGKWSVLEVFTWTCAITMMAASRGWEAHEPITLPGWNILDNHDYNRALDYIDRVNPDLLVLAWPCTVWSQLQAINATTPWRRFKLAQRDASRRQRRRGGAVLGENPHQSMAWKEPMIIEAFDGMESGTTDMCQFGLRVPGGNLLRKRTALKGTKEVVRRCCRKCCGNHRHDLVFGSAKIHGKWTTISEFAGGYTKQFAQAVVEGAEEYLKKGRVPEVLVSGGAFEEELFEQPEEESPTGGGDLWRIQHLHQRLGHPTNQTLAKMLSLAGASKSMVKMAQDFQCETCQELQAPGRYMKARPEIKPVSFGLELHCDLKYIHDFKNQLYVALSIVDAATSFHTAVMLKNRTAAHVARKFARHWCSLYGIPGTIVVDQGGEFDGEFVGWLETHGIHSKCTGAKSAWQHGFAERHGALLGTACSSLVWQYQATGLSEVKDCLAAAVQAKNMTITRKGYSPYQLAFGRAPFFPDLLDEDVEGNLSLRQAMTLEGEVARQSEMRASARAVLLRQDTQDKLRRALQRWPRGDQVDFTPGDMVFFYSPKPKSARFKKDGGAWRGPAIVLMRESEQRFFVSWRGRCLLVSTPNLKLASAAEAGNHDVRREEAEKVEELLERDQGYEDLSHVPPPPVQKEDGTEGWEVQDTVIRPSKRGRPKNQAKEIAKSLKGMKTVIKTVQKRRKETS